MPAHRLVLVVLFLGACDPRSLPNDDAGSILDGGLPDRFIPGEDAGSDAQAPEPDAGPTGQAYLQPCTANADCQVGLYCATDFPRPFCTRICANQSTCGSGAACVDDRCVPTCRSGARQCDAIGGSCSVGPTSFCIPACGATGTTSSNCRSGWTCDPYRGVCALRPSTAGADIGQPCETNDDCRSGVCLSEWEEGSPTGWIGGYCVGSTRSPSGSSTEVLRGGCPAGSVMMIGTPTGDTTLCLRECRRPSDCRPGYYCGAPAGATVGFCLPIDCDVPGVPACPTGSSCQTLPGGTRGCVTCRPSCAGRTCGDDGCGGSCGSCGATETCTPEGTCACRPEDNAELCARAGWSCGAPEVVDRCGVARTAMCGMCPAPFECGLLTPGRCDCIAETDEELCAARGATCGTLRVTDRCGASRDISCGSCTSPETCGGAGVPNACGVCTRRCTGRVCGDDGCGGSCGTCPTGRSCTTSGQCEVVPCDPVMNTLCPTGERCEWVSTGNECIPAGTGRAGDFCSFGVQCAAQHTCSGEGFCREYCTSDSHCAATGARCAFTLVGSSYGLCSRPCDPVARTGCPAGSGCRLLNGPRSTEVTDCGVTGTGSAGSSCTSASSCLSGHTCLGGSCRRVCRLGTTCTSGSACAAVSGWFTYGICP